MTSDKGRKGAPAEVPGYPYPIGRREVDDVDYQSSRRPSFRIRLPAAGTVIANHSIFGEWKAELYVDGAALKCAKPGVFTIDQ